MQPRLSDDEQSYERVLSSGAHAVLDFLRRRGRFVLCRYRARTGKLKAEIETALWELVAAGMVTADGFDNLRSLINPKRRLGPGSAKAVRPRHTPGRWSLLYGAEASEHTTRADGNLLDVVAALRCSFSRNAGRESNLPKWRELLIAFRRLEDRGEVRGGRLSAASWANSLRCPRRLSRCGPCEICPPAARLLLCPPRSPEPGCFIVPGERVAAISGKYVSFRDGVPVEAEDRLSALREAAAQ